MNNLQKKEFRKKIKHRKYVQSRLLHIYNNEYSNVRKEFCYLTDERLKDIKCGNIAIIIINELLEPYNFNYEYFPEDFEQLEKFIGGIIDTICNTNIN